jgi:hypothetical protein
VGAPANAIGGDRDRRRRRDVRGRAGFHSSVVLVPSAVDGLPFALVLKSKALYGGALVLVAAAALAVSTMSSPTRGDLVFGMVSCLVFLVFTAVGGSTELGLTLGLRRLLRRQLPRGSAAAIAAMLVGGVAAFPIGAGWDAHGQRASGLVPAAQALMTPVWPASAWNEERLRVPLVAYAYTCCD